MWHKVHENSSESFENFVVLGENDAGCIVGRIRNEAI